MARDNGQLHVSASVAEALREHRPYYREGEAPKTSVNVAMSKDAKRIAAGVRRRLLPEHEREAAACAANKARHDDLPEFDLVFIHYSGAACGWIVDSP